VSVYELFERPSYMTVLQTSCDEYLSLKSCLHLTTEPDGH